MRHRCGLKFQPTFTSSLASLGSRKTLIETRLLSAEHLLGIILHYCVVVRKQNQIESQCSFRHGNFFIHDPTETAFISYVSKDWVKMKLLLSWMLGGDEKTLDRSIVPFEFAKYVKKLFASKFQIVNINVISEMLLHTATNLPCHVSQRRD